MEVTSSARMNWKCEQVSRIIFEQKSGAFKCVALWGKDPDFPFLMPRQVGVTQPQVNVSSVLHDESKS